jgi:trehalose-phosphatase
MTTAVLPISPALSARLEGTPLILLLDIDGTLSPIAPRPDSAIVPPETRRILDELTAAPGVQVVFVTGRSADDGRRIAGVDGGWVIGNHGMELAAPRQRANARPDVAPFAAQVAEAVSRISALADQRGWSGVLVEDKRLTLSVHYRLADSRLVPTINNEVQRIGTELGLRATLGKSVIELRPPIAVDKGIAAVELVESLAAAGDTPSILAAGDDRTDEDLFRVVRSRYPRSVTVRVGGDAPTEAEFSVPDTIAMRQLLGEVLASRRPTSAGPL